MKNNIGIDDNKNAENMYYMMECLDPSDGFMALIDYRSDDPRRSWTRGSRFKNEPPVPVTATLKMREGSKLIEMWPWPVPLMSIRLHDALVHAGVSNLDTYPAQLIDHVSGAVYSDYVAFNIVGTIAVADLGASKYDAGDGPLLFRLAESTNGIVVHKSVRAVIEAAGIDTLSFVKPEDWTS